jgi:dGTPase
VQRPLTIPDDDVVAGLDDRLRPEEPPSIRTEAQRDRDRILYSAALLRLGHVTQVAAPEVGHIFHSRLSHSMKVAQVAHGLAQRLKALADRDDLDDAAKRVVACLDEDATEAAALAHDLGHPPFGHLAEQVLQERSKGVATFEGNPQSFRIVTRLALRSVDSRGLNLTRRTLNGILKYPWLRSEEPPERSEKWGAYDVDREAFEWARKGYPAGERTLEACLMDWADDVTYAIHDMDDFYRAGLIPLERLTASDGQELEAFKGHLHERAEDLAKEEGKEAEDPPDPAVVAKRLEAAADRLFSGLISSIRAPFTGRTEERVNLRQVGSTLIGHYIAEARLRGAGGDGPVIFEIDDHTVEEVKVLKELTWFYVINRPSLAVIQRGQREIMQTLYKMYKRAIADGDLHTLPPVFAERARTAKVGAGIERVVIDLLAGMTEEGALEIYRQRTGITRGSLLMRASGPA